MNEAAREGVLPPMATHRRSDNDKDARFSCSICTDAVMEPVVTQCGHLYCWPCLYRWLEPGMTPAERNGLMGLTSVVLNAPAAADASKRVCPVCRAPCSVKRIIPIYVRTDVPFQTARTEHPRVRGGEDDDGDDDDPVGVVQDIVANDDEDEEETIHMDHSHSRTGLRFRPHREDAAAMDAASPDGISVPRRPVARSASHLQLAERTDVAVASLRSTTTHPASLSHGMLPLVQQALRHAAAVGGADFVPPLHRLEGMHPAAPNDGAAPISNRESTEFLSWLLLLLGSFVLFCLLLF